MKVKILKDELIDMIRKENDIDTLNALKTFLIDKQKSNILRDKLEIRAKKANQEIAEGNLYSTEEVLQVLNKN